MASTAIDSDIHGFLFSTDEMREIGSDRSRVQKWLDTEAALARAQGELGGDSERKGGHHQSVCEGGTHRYPFHRGGYKSSITMVPLLNAFKIPPRRCGVPVPTRWGIPRR